VARILVVDDEHDVRELFNITLKMAGHTTETAKDGVEAVDKLDDPLPDLILLDLMMPHMDGFEFLSHLRARLDDRPLRVLVATAKVLEEEDQRQLAMWPVVGVLSKAELDIAQMVNIVGRALTKDPRRKNGRAKPASRGEKPAQKAAPGKPPAPEPAKPAKPEPAAPPEKPRQAAPSLSPPSPPAEKAAKPTKPARPEPAAPKPAEKTDGGDKQAAKRKPETSADEDGEAPDRKSSLLQRFLSAKKKPPDE
jgi:CheY-like chemotaxis protein